MVVPGSSLHKLRVVLARTMVQDAGTIHLHLSLAGTPFPAAMYLLILLHLLNPLE